MTSATDPFLTESALADRGEEILDAFVTVPRLKIYVIASEARGARYNGYNAFAEFFAQGETKRTKRIPLTFSAAQMFMLCKEKKKGNEGEVGVWRSDERSRPFLNIIPR